MLERIKQRFTLPTIILCLLLAAFIVFFIFKRGGFGGGWIWLIVLLCPATHLFMMRGNHHGHSHKDEATESSSCRGDQKKEDKE